MRGPKTQSRQMELSSVGTLMAEPGGSDPYNAASVRAIASAETLIFGIFEKMLIKKFDDAKMSFLQSQSTESASLASAEPPSSSVMNAFNIGNGEIAKNEKLDLRDVMRGP